MRDDRKRPPPRDLVAKARHQSASAVAGLRHAVRHRTSGDGYDGFIPLCQLLPPLPATTAQRIENRRCCIYSESTANVPSGCRLSPGSRPFEGSMTIHYSVSVSASSINAKCAMRMAIPCPTVIRGLR
jgi:hypothetical protein